MTSVILKFFVLPINVQNKHYNKSLLSLLLHTPVSHQTSWSAQHMNHQHRSAVNRSPFAASPLAFRDWRQLLHAGLVSLPLSWRGHELCEVTALSATSAEKKMMLSQQFLTPAQKGRADWMFT